MVWKKFSDKHFKGKRHLKGGLTGTETEIMSIFWDSGEDAFTFKNLKEYVHEHLEKNWKNQTLSTFLSNLRNW